MEEARVLDRQLGDWSSCAYSLFLPEGQGVEEEVRLGIFDLRSVYSN